jgi:hypothetical protein
MEGRERREYIEYIYIVKEEGGRSAGEGREGTLDREKKRRQESYTTVGFVS